MKQLLLTFAFFALSFAAMAIGVILSNRRIKGSCGGIANAMGEDCRACDCGRQQQCYEK